MKVYNSLDDAAVSSVTGFEIVLAVCESLMFAMSVTNNVLSIIYKVFDQLTIVTHSTYLQRIDRFEIQVSPSKRNNIVLIAEGSNLITVTEKKLCKVESFKSQKLNCLK